MVFKRKNNTSYNMNNTGFEENFNNYSENPYNKSYDNNGLNKKNIKRKNTMPALLFLLSMIVGVIVVVQSTTDEKYPGDTRNIVERTRDEVFGLTDNYRTHLGDRYDFKQLRKEIVKTIDENNTEKLSKHLEQNTENINDVKQYQESFVQNLNVLVDKMDKDSVLSKGEENINLKKEVEKYRKYYTRLKTTFYATDNFNPIDNYVTKDGEIIQDNGVNHNRLTLLPEQIAVAEKKTREYEIEKIDGNYLTSAETIAGFFGMEVVYGLDKMNNKCNTSEIDKTITIGSFCEATPNILYLSDEDFSTKKYSDPSVIDTVKHEISHHIISKICGTVVPPAGGDIIEGVTSSYAIIYLNADSTTLNASGYSHPEYAVTAKTNKIARQIHDNSACYDQTILNEE